MDYGLLARSSPNLPGMSPNRQSWIHREREGFQRTMTISRPSTASAHIRGQESPMFDQSNHIFPDNSTNQQESSPKGMKGPRPSTAQFPSIRPFSPTKGSPERCNSATGLGAFHLGSRTLETANQFSPLSKPQTTIVPRFVTTDKMVCRFHGFIETRRPWEENGPLGTSKIESHLIRYMTILYYLYDDTVEINEVKEVNAGLMQGAFLKRVKAKKDDGSPLRLTDLQPGRVVNIFGHVFHISDADTFTREYFSKELHIDLSPQSRPMTASDRNLSRSFVSGQDTKDKTHVLGCQFATGLGPVEPTLYDKDRSFRSCSTSYVKVKQELEKSHRFHQYGGKRLHFTCIEVQQTQPPYFMELESLYSKLLNSCALSANEVDLQKYHGFVGSDSVKKFVLNFYLDTNYVDLGILDKQIDGQDEPSLLVKKGLLPIDWRMPDRGHLEVSDIRVGEVLDIYGRYFLVVDCDDHTREHYVTEFSMPQTPVLLLKEQLLSIVHPIPGRGQGSLPIGSNEDSLSNVYGMPKVAKDTGKARRNQNKQLRAKAVLLKGNDVDLSRSFLVIFYLEDDTLQIHEEIQRNSGVVGGSFLKRGKYMNDGATLHHRQKVEQELMRHPPHHGIPSIEQQLALFQPIYISSHEIFLGNVLTVNNFVLQLVEMDNMSLQFCESYPMEFPFSDAKRLLKRLLQTVHAKRLDLRPHFRRADTQNLGHCSFETALRVLDALQLVDEWNDQEVLTLLRRFQEKASTRFAARLPGASAGSASASPSTAAVVSPAAHKHQQHQHQQQHQQQQQQRKETKKHDTQLLITATVGEGFGKEERSDDLVFCYDDCCDHLVSLYAGQSADQAAVNILPASAQDAWPHFLHWCRTRSLTWRALLSKESLPGFAGKMTLSTVQALLLRHGVPNSLVSAVLPLLEERYAVSRDEQKLIATYLRKRLFTTGHSQSPATVTAAAATPSPTSSPHHTASAKKFLSISISNNNNSSSGSGGGSSGNQPLSPSQSFVSSTAGRIANLRRMRDKLSVQLQQMQQQQQQQPAAAAVNTSPGATAKNRRSRSRSATPANAQQDDDEDDDVEEESLSRKTAKQQRDQQQQQVIVEGLRLCDDIFEPLWV